MLRPQWVRGVEAAVSQGWGGRSESEMGRPQWVRGWEAAVSQRWRGRSESEVWRPQWVRGGEAAVSQRWGGRSESEVGRPQWVRGGEAAVSQRWGGRSESEMGRPQWVRDGEAAVSQRWGGRSESEMGRPQWVRGGEAASNISSSCGRSSQRQSNVAWALAVAAFCVWRKLCGLLSEGRALTQAEGMCRNCATDIPKGTLTWQLETWLLTPSSPLPISILTVWIITCVLPLFFLCVCLSVFVCLSFSLSLCLSRKRTCYQQLHSNENSATFTPPPPNFPLCMGRWPSQ